MTISNALRRALFDFAGKNIVVPVEQAALDRAYAKVAPAIRAEIDKRFPPDDMAVLKKYRVADTDYCINKQYGFRDDMKFDFRFEDALAPVLPSTRCEDRVFEWTDKTAKLLLAYHEAALTHKKAREAKLEAYRQLVFSASSMKAIIEVWPAAAALAPETTRLPSLSADAIALIKRDNAGAMAA